MNPSQAPVFFAGMILSLSLIMAIGPQNAHVMRMGLLRQHVWPTISVCVVTDIALIGTVVAEPARLAGHGGIDRHGVAGLRGAGERGVWPGCSDGFCLVVCRPGWRHGVPGPAFELPAALARDGCPGGADDVGNGAVAASRPALSGSSACRRRRPPVRTLAVILFQKINPQPHPQRQVLALREHRVDTIGRRGKRFQHRHQQTGRNF